MTETHWTPPMTWPTGVGCDSRGTSGSRAVPTTTMIVCGNFINRGR